MKIAIRNGVPVKEKPSVKSPDTATFDKYDEVLGLSDYDEFWYTIKISNKVSGFIRKVELKEVPDGQRSYYRKRKYSELLREFQFD